MYDFLIVGAGMYGSCFARTVTDLGYSCLVIDKRNHIGGNCYSHKVGNIDVHQYGPHTFHTSDERVWSFVNRFSRFNSFVNRPKAKFEGKVFSFPINLMTLNQLWGVTCPQEAKQKLEQVKVRISSPTNLEEWALSQVGEEVYHTFFEGYTAKQWGRHPSELPTSIIRRLPIRLNYNDSYYNDLYQGVPEDGYDSFFIRMLDGISLQLGVDYLESRKEYDKLGKVVVYTGNIDQFFDYRLGELEWRSLDFRFRTLETSDHQGNAIINHTGVDVPYTRTVEFKHFTGVDSTSSVVCDELPKDWSIGKEAYYPVPTEENVDRYKKYRKMIDHQKYIFGGRLAEYRYYDMHQVVAAAIKKGAEAPRHYPDIT